MGGSSAPARGDDFWTGLRALAFLMVQKEIWEGVPSDKIYLKRSVSLVIPNMHCKSLTREEWAAFEPQNLADAAFGAGMIAAYLKVTLLGLSLG